MIEYLTEAGELEDGHVCYHSARGIKVNGYIGTEFLDENKRRS